MHSLVQHSGDRPLVTSNSHGGCNCVTDLLSAPNHHGHAHVQQQQSHVSVIMTPWPGQLSMCSSAHAQVACRDMVDTCAGELPPADAHVRASVQASSRPESTACPHALQQSGQDCASTARAADGAASVGTAPDAGRDAPADAAQTAPPGREAMVVHPARLAELIDTQWVRTAMAHSLV